MSLLRYNGRHSLHFPGDWRLPRLDPMEYRSHSERGKRTSTWHEPLWMFRLRQRLFAFAGKQRCGDRGPGTEEPDTWDRGPDGYRTCSYCGSLHYDDLMDICRKTLTDPSYGVERTQKNYKVYVRQPGVQNAGQGAIKYYSWHSPEKISEADAKTYSKACLLTHERRFPNVA